jgi:transcription elongation factor Elf1
VTALIKRSLELANWPPLERNKQLPRRIAFWTEALFPRIERARLPLAFDEALDTHRSEYPVNAYELIQADRRLKKREEAARRAAEQVRVAEDGAVECTHCDAERLEEVHVPLENKDYKVPCSRCRPRAHAQRREQLFGKKPVMVSLSDVARHAASLKIGEEDREEVSKQAGA